MKATFQKSLGRTLIIILGMMLWAATVTSVFAFNFGDRVQCTVNLNVRSTASTSGSLLTTEVSGSKGTIESGTSQSANGFTWWYITWDNGFTGWSVDSLQLIASTPTISSVSPNPATGANSAQTLTINGSGFVSGAQVKLAYPSVGVVAAGSQTFSATFISSSQLQISPTYANDPGTWTAQVINPGSVTSSTFSFSVQAPAPVITSLSPSSATAGGSAFNITVNGSTFDQSSIVRWNGVNLTTTPNVSSGLTTYLTAQVPASDITSAGSATVTVFTPSPGGGTSSGTTFTINSGTPTISSVSPNPATGANSAQTLTVNGSGFVSGAQVKLTYPAVGVVAAGSQTFSATFISSSQLQISPTYANDPGTWTAQVINPGSITSSTFNFSVQAPAPVIMSLSPSSASAGGSSFTLTVNGTTFDQSSVVQWNGTSLTTAHTVNSGLTTAISATIPASDIASAGSATVTVFTPSPGGGTSSGVTFTISSSGPTITSVLPNPITADAANAYQTLTINGANFVNKPTLVLTWTGQSGYTLSASQVTYVSSSQLTMSIHLGAAADNWTVKAVNPDTQSSSAVGFQVLAPNGTSGCSFQDTYPYPAANIYNANNPSDPSTIDPWNFYNRECTSYVAWKLNQSAGTTTSPYFFYNLMQGGHWGDAGNWSANAATLGYTVNTTPAVGSIAQWNAGEPGGGTVGHVAYVEAVNSDGTVAVSEYNYHLDHNFDLRCSVTPPRFLHIHDVSIAPPPSISSVSPNPVIGSNSKQTFNVNGSGFVSGAQVKLIWPAVGVAPAGNATLSATFVNSSQLQVGATFGNDPATWTAQVINPGSVTSSAYNFPLQAPIPIIQLLSPSSASIGGSIFTLTVNGSTFDQSSIVRWNGVSLPTTPVVSSGGLTTVLQAQVPASDIASAGTATVTVFNPSPGGGTSAGVIFNIGGSSPTTSKGVDYSVNPPSISALKTQGYGFVVRYVSATGNAKNITSTEAQSLQAAGLGIILVFESTGVDMQDGYASGVADANTAVTTATAAGAPQNFFCYFACDFDAQPSDQTAINAYLDGAASVLGIQRVGFYGGYYPLKSVLDAGKAAKGWQTTAWSAGNIDSRISLYQYMYNQTSAGGLYDIDEGFGSDLGQWSFTSGGGGSSPMITSPKLTGTTFTLSVPTTQIGFNYTLEYKNSFSDATWTAVQTIAGTGGTIILTDTGATSSSRLYHVHVQ